MYPDDCKRQEPDAQNDIRLELFDTGGGYLLLRSRVEYDPKMEMWIPLETELLGVAEVTNWKTIKDIVESLGFDIKYVRRLPELSFEDIE